MASMTPPTLPLMPGHSHPSAPKFTGIPAHLDMFFDELEMLSQACNLTVAQMIRWTVLYAPTEDYELWKYAEQQQINEDNNWEIFKAHVYGFYPGSDDDRRYRLADLEALSARQQHKAMDTLEDFGLYYREFYKVWYFLRCRDRITDREASRLFILGFNAPFRTKLRTQLKLQYPRHHEDDPFGLSELYDVAIFVISCRFPDLEAVKQDYGTIDQTFHSSMDQSTPSPDLYNQHQLKQDNETPSVMHQAEKESSKQAPSGALYSSFLAQTTTTPGDNGYQQDADDVLASTVEIRSDLNISTGINSKEQANDVQKELFFNSETENVKPVSQKRSTFPHSWLKDDYMNPSEQEQANLEKVYVLACATVSQTDQSLYSVHPPNAASLSHTNISPDKQDKTLTSDLNNKTAHTLDPFHPAKAMRIHMAECRKSHDSRPQSQILAATRDMRAISYSQSHEVNQMQQVRQDTDNTHLWQMSGTHDAIRSGCGGTIKSRHGYDTGSHAILRQSNIHAQDIGNQWSRCHQNDKLSNPRRTRYPRKKYGYFRNIATRGSCTSI